METTVAPVSAITHYAEIASEGARGGVGLAKQNIEGSQRQNFCAKGASPTSPDRLKLSIHPSQPENVKSIARKKAAKTE